MYSFFGVNLRKAEAFERLVYVSLAGDQEFDEEAVGVSHSASKYIMLRLCFA